MFGGLLVVFGAWSLFEPEGGRSDGVLALIGGIVIIALRGSDFGRSHGAALAAGRVAWTDGRIEIHSITGDNHTAYFYRMGDVDFPTTEEGAKAIDARRRYRVYHVPDTDLIVNVEPLGSPPSTPRTP